ncbi:TIM-barrel domain-containing protein [Flavobacterium sp. 5]|uniref:TIM-barrel domain-containing protein n=1 Tax=Flavobacterium sp. 5 TaxID=2035199 RepID=UPI000C2BBDE9|nr:TIM-barrel domain-containing protein [Flavobacterium sp. 5]PKB15138.1 putative secreted protein (Por secretion system target) [Flavobacterium sp. 5]
MKKGFKLLALVPMLVLNIFISWSQTSNMVGDNVAVFYPNNFNPAGTLPSLIFVNDFTNQGSVPSSWSIKPVFSTANGKSVVKISYTGSVDFYGNGEVSGPLKRNDTQVTLWNSEAPNYWIDNGTRLYQSHPWIMGIRPNGTAFGIIADHTWKQSFVISNPITITSDGPGFRVIVIERNSPQELLKTLADLTGKIDLPALWTLGYQQSRFTYTPDSKVKSIADEFRNRKIPCDVLWMDIDYMDKFKIFTFDPSTFSNPKGLNDYLHTKNFKAVYMIDPGVKKETGYFVYDQGKAGNHWVQKADGTEFNGQVWPGDVAFPDFTRPETSKWWSGLYKDFMAKGIDGIWNDMNEPSVFETSNKTMPEDNLHRGGGDMPAGSHLRYHNVYGYMMVKASREGIAAANPDKRPFVLSRSNFLGGQRYAATWTGDNSSTWAHLKLSIPMSITLGLSGQPISGADIGGFNNDCTPDLLGHWMALGAYYPFSRNHSVSGSINQEPWAFGSEIENVSRTAVNRRYRLLPYMYTLLREASQTGMPLMRPVFFADNTDLSLRSEQQAFMVGKDLLVIPRWAVNPNLPKGNWNKVKLEATEDDKYQALLYVRPGSVVPITEVVQSTTDYKSDNITYLINPLEDGTATGEIYHDDGDGFGYKTNDYATHEINVTKHNADSLKVVISQTAGSKNINRISRTGYVTDNGIVYSAWSTSTVRYIPLIPDNNQNIDLSMVNTMFLKGSFNANLTPMINVGDKKWKFDGLNLKAGQTYTLKFIQSKNANGFEWGGAVGLSGNAMQTTDSSNTISFTINSDGNYSVTFDESTLKYVIQKTPAINSLSIVGDATDLMNFDMLGLPMNQSLEDLNVFTWTGHLFPSNGKTEGKFKFHNGTGGQCDDVWIYANSSDQSLSSTSMVIANGCSYPDNKWKVKTGENGTYKITVNVATNVVKIEKLHDFATLSITGDATSIGWDPKGLPMNHDLDHPNVFTWTGTLTASDGTSQGRFKIHSGPNNWCDDTWLYASVADQSLSANTYEIFPGCTGPDNKWKVKAGETGSYKITIDVVAKTINIEKMITSLAIVGDATSIGWDPKGLPMQQSTDNAGIYTWTGTLSAANGTTEGKLKFHSGLNGICDDIWLYSTTDNQSISNNSFTIANGCTSADNKWKIKAGETGTYKVTVDIKTKKVSFQKTILESLSIVGDATSAGNDSKGLLMEQSNENLNIFKWTGILSATNGSTEGKFKFHSGGGLCEDAWLYASETDQTLSGTAFTKVDGCTTPDDMWKVQVGETGTYKVTVNLETNKISIKNISTSLGLASPKKEKSFIYPNPVGNTLFFSTKMAGINISIFSPTGSLVLKQKVDNNNSVDVSKLKVGTYFIITNKNQMAIKFIKK